MRIKSSKRIFFQRVQRLLNISFYMSLSKYDFCFDCCSFDSSMWLLMFIKHSYECSTSLFSLESVFAGGHVDEKYSIVTSFQFNSAWAIILDCENTPTVRNGEGVQGRYTLGPSTSEHVVAIWNLMQRNEAECDGNPKFLFRLILTGTFFSYFKKTAFTEGVWYIC